MGKPITGKLDLRVFNRIFFEQLDQTKAYAHIAAYKLKNATGKTKIHLLIKIGDATIPIVIGEKAFNKLKDAAEEHGYTLDKLQ